LGITREYTIWSPEYNNFSGGIRALHVLNNELNKRGMKSKLHYKEPNNPNDIVLYPEIITDNPLNSDYVCRWLLAQGENKDLCFEWVKGLNGDYLLTVNIIDLNIFYPQKNERKNVGYWVGKGTPNYPLPDNAELIQKFNPNDRTLLAQQLASYEYIISFDSFTAINHEATLLGTPVFLSNVTHDWTKEKLKNTGWPLYGFFWDMADLGKAKIEVKKQFEAYTVLCKEFDKSIDNFIEISQTKYV
jgi:hypothetical protein